MVRDMTKFNLSEKKCSSSTIKNYRILKKISKKDFFNLDISNKLSGKISDYYYVQFLNNTGSKTKNIDRRSNVKLIK